LQVNKYTDKEERYTGDGNQSTEEENKYTGKETKFTEDAGPTHFN
jgi:hypothetical protein